MFNYGNANEAQKEAISATDGLVLITAGPGTGKTFTLVKRAVYLIQECGIKPEQIMMATFTEKAAKELITRITNELAERNVSVNVNEMYIGTFHSLCLRIIKENLEFTRLKRNYRLLDTFDQKYLVFRNFHKFKNIEGIDELLSKGGSWKRSDEICTYINHLSEEMVDIEALQSDDNPGIRTLGRVLSVYQEMLEEGNLIDFSTIQTECYKLLIYYIIDAINDAINAGKQISFQYYDYTGLKKKVLKNKGEVYKFSPYKLLWCGDYYYVLGYSEKKSKVINFRVDRIASKPEILDKDIIPMPDDFDIENYTKEVFFMFSGEKVLVDLRCDNSLMKTMVDRFGEDVTTLAYDMTSFRVQTEVSASPTFFGWVFGFNGKVQILAPESLKEQYRQMLTKATEDMKENE